MKKQVRDGMINASTPSAKIAMSSADLPSLCIQIIAITETIGMLANKDARNILRLEVSVISTIIATVSVILATYAIVVINGAIGIKFKVIFP